MNELKMSSMPSLSNSSPSPLINHKKLLSPSNSSNHGSINSNHGSINANNCSINSNHGSMNSNNVSINANNCPNTHILVQPSPSSSPLHRISSSGSGGNFPTTLATLTTSNPLSMISNSNLNSNFVPLSTIQLPPGIKLEQNNVNKMQFPEIKLNSGNFPANIILSPLPQSSLGYSTTSSTTTPLTNSLINSVTATTTNAIADPNLSADKKALKSPSQNQTELGENENYEDLFQDPEVKAYVSTKPHPMDTSKLKYTCNACQFSPKQLTALCEHINGVHLKRKHLCCQMCAFKTSRKRSLTVHMTEVHSTQKRMKRYPCQLCDFKGARKSSLDKHLLVRHGPVYQCKHCDYSNKKEADFKGHMLVAHGIQDVVQQEPATPKINSNGSKILSSDQLITYSNTLEHGYCCSICKYAPSSLRYLRDHIRKVHLSKLIKCPHCDLKTKRKADLIKHIKRLHPETIGQEQQQQGSQIMTQTFTTTPMQQQQQFVIPQAILPTQPTPLSSKPSLITTTAVLGHNQRQSMMQTDALLNVALKSEIPITLHLQYPVQNITQQNMSGQQITLPTIDTSALLNSYPAPAPNAPNATIQVTVSTSSQMTMPNPSPVTATMTQSGSSKKNSKQKQNAAAAAAANQHNPTHYKKGMHQTFDEGTKCDDLILYTYNYPYGIGCSVCNYAPQTLRYLRDHIRKVHLAKTYNCPHCELKTKRRADLMRHIKRIHEDPRRFPNSSPSTTSTSTSLATSQDSFVSGQNWEEIFL